MSRAREKERVRGGDGYRVQRTAETRRINLQAKLNRYEPTPLLASPDFRPHSSLLLCHRPCRLARPSDRQAAWLTLAEPNARPPAAAEGGQRVFVDLSTSAARELRRPRRRIAVIKTDMRRRHLVIAG